jgi:hypothetical protein
MQFKKKSLFESERARASEKACLFEGLPCRFEKGPLFEGARAGIAGPLGKRLAAEYQCKDGPDMMHLFISELEVAVVEKSEWIEVIVVCIRECMVELCIWRINKRKWLNRREGKGLPFSNRLECRVRWLLHGNRSGLGSRGRFMVLPKHVFCST